MLLGVDSDYLQTTSPQMLLVHLPLTSDIGRDDVWGWLSLEGMRRGCQPQEKIGDDASHASIGCSMAMLPELEVCSCTCHRSAVFSEAAEAALFRHQYRLLVNFLLIPDPDWLSVRCSVCLPQSALLLSLLPHRSCMRPGSKVICAMRGEDHLDC